jgi:cephalosporin hydroxylase
VPETPTGDGRVQVAYLHGDHGDRVSHSWHESMMRLVFHDLVYEQRLVETDGPFMTRCDAGGLVEARNLCVTRFLDETPHEWLFFVDTDMGFGSDTVDRLIHAADPAERPVVGALCFGMRLVRDDGMGGSRVMPVPTLFSMARTPEGYVGFGTRWHFPDDTLVQVAATGAACLLIHRSAVEKVRAEDGDRWFEQKRYEDGRLLAEDLSFCYRLGAAGIPIFVHTGVKTTHHKTVWIGADDYTPPGPSVTGEYEPVDHPAGLSVHIDLAGSLASLARNEHVNDGMLKLPADLDRYAEVIEATKPEVVVETGTHAGASARWFSQHGVDVITVDVATDADYRIDQVWGHAVSYVSGSSTDPAVVARVAELVAGRRCMVSLDSDHSGPHVAKEIELYGPLVSRGCYLVVEDGIFGYAPTQLVAQHGLTDLVGSPLDAIAAHLHGDPQWSRDVAIERVHGPSHSPAGWWLRNG